MIARFPFGKLRQIADLSLVSYIEKPRGEGGEGMLDISTGSIKANTFWDASPSITGAGMDLGIVDRGINGDISRLQADERHFFYSPDSTDYTEIGYQSSSEGNHGTSVTAIVAATGDTLGVAYGLDDVISAGRILDVTTPIVYGAYDWIVAVVPPDSGETAEVINCSAGSQSVSGESYPNEAKFIDSVVDHWGVPVVVPAGNLGDPEKRLVHGAHSYNAIVVGNIDDNNDTTRSNDSIYSTSSRGPTYDDRRKPDLVAPGTDISSLIADTTWYEWTGTSFAAPHVAGAVLLLRQKTGLSDTKALKAVLINSADDSTGAGDPAGWDKAYGWGYLNLQKVYQNSTWYYVHAINHGQTRRYKVAMDTGDKVTLVWNKHVAWNGPNAPTNVYPVSHLALYLKTYPGGTLVASDTTDTSGVLQVKWTDSPDTAYVDVKAKSIGGPSVGDSYALAACDSIIYVGLAKPVLARGKVPREVMLAQNYPNPFNPVTVIRFELPHSSDVRLSIYNTTGQLVRRLAEGTYEHGIHRLAWDSKDGRGVEVASGIYFYRLEAGELVQTRRMVLLR